MALWTKAEIAKMITDDYDEQGKNYLESLADEIVDGLMPAYYRETLEQWTALPNEYTDEGANRYGSDGIETGIFGLMNLDLYAYYYDLTREIIDEMESESAK